MSGSHKASRILKVVFTLSQLFPVQFHLVILFIIFGLLVFVSEFFAYSSIVKCFAFIPEVFGIFLEHVQMGMSYIKVFDPFS